MQLFLSGVHSKPDNWAENAKNSYCKYNKESKVETVQQITADKPSQLLSRRVEKLNENPGVMLQV